VGLMLAYRDANSQIDTRLGVTTSTAIYSSQTHTGTPAYTRGSPWIGNVNTTCISPWNNRTGDDGGVKMGGCLITPQDMAFDAHYWPSVGDVFRCVAANGSYEDKTIESRASYAAGTASIGIVHFSSAFSAAITPAKVLPANWRMWFKNSGYGIGGCFTDQQEKILVADIASLSMTTDAGKIVSFGQPGTALRLSAWESPVSGDSSDPICLILDGELVFLGALLTAASALAIHEYLDEINNLLSVTLGSAYTLTEFDLSGYDTVAQGKRVLALA
jgi:hypothetical protein